jgi:hypothetical protein
MRAKEGAIFQKMTTFITTTENLESVIKKSFREYLPAYNNGGPVSLFSTHLYKL